MQLPPTEGDLIQLPTPVAFSLCDGLLRMAHRLIVELPEPGLREVRRTLNVLSTRADQLLDSAELDLALNFDHLSMDPEVNSGSHVPGAEDFGGVIISTSVSTVTDGSGSTLPPSSRHRRNTISRVPAPAMTVLSTPAPTPAPVRVPTPTPASILTHGRFPLVLSSRDNVGLPDYAHHPLFVRPGIPGTYQHPPTASQYTSGGFRYVVSRGLYVGIFDDWDEIAPWVIGISGSVYRKANSWEEARDLYNARLAAGAVRILA